MTEIKIDKGVPIIPITRPSIGRAVWGRMVPDDSVFFPSVTSEKISARVGSWVRGRRNGWLFKTRTVTENGVKGVRVWRVK